VIEDVGWLMGIRGFKDILVGLSLRESILRVEVSGYPGLYLTVVGIPCIISVVSEEETDEDFESVHHLVECRVKSDEYKSWMLHAFVHPQNASFPEHMRGNGQKRKMHADQSSTDSSDI
jgi:hypothetical protein